MCDFKNLVNLCSRHPNDSNLIFFDNLGPGLLHVVKKRIDVRTRMRISTATYSVLRLSILNSFQTDLNSLLLKLAQLSFNDFLELFGHPVTGKAWKLRTKL